MGRSILIASGKGGAGRSTFAINLGACLAQTGQKVCLLDFNMGLRNMDIYMGLENRIIFDLGDVFNGVCELKKALVSDARFGSLYLLESPQNKLIKGLEKGHVKALLKQLKEMFDYVIIDGPSGVGKDLELAAGGADSAVLVMQADYLSVRSSDAVNRRLELLGVKSRCYVINQLEQRVFESGMVPNMEAFNKAFSIPMAGIIPYDVNIHLGNNNGKPVVLARDSYIAKNFFDIVFRMLG